VRGEGESIVRAIKTAIWQFFAARASPALLALFNFIYVIISKVGLTAYPWSFRVNFMVKKIFKHNKIAKIFFSLFFIWSFLTPQLAGATLYAPGETLEPDCGPTDPDCGVLTFSLNGLSTSTQLFATGTTGTDFNIDSISTTHTFNFPTASALNRGLLSATDWTTFNNKFSNALDMGKIFVGDGSNLASPVALSGDGTLSSTGLFSLADNAITTSKILDGNVTYAKLQGMSASKLLGNSSSSSATAEEVSLGFGLTFSGTDLKINSPVCGTNERLSWDGTAFVCKAGAAFISTSANTFLAGPTSGSAATSSYRAIVAADLGSGSTTNQEVLLGNQSWFTLLDGSGKIQSSVLPSSITGSLKFQGTWDADTNSPTLSPGGVGGISGDFYVVDVAGTTTLDGHSVWNVGDWVINASSSWDRVEQGATVSSVNGAQGAVVLTTDDVNQGLSNKYFSNSLARNAFVPLGPITLSTTTGEIDCPTCLTATSSNGDLISGTGIGLSGTLADRLIGSGDMTFSLNDTAVSAGTYGSSASVPLFTVDAQGRLTNAGTTTLDTSAISSGNLSVARGGTGVGTFTANGVLYGSSTSALMATAAGTSGQFLVANSSGVPTFVTASGDVTISSAGVVTISTGAVTSAKILDSTIVNADISGSAAIAYSKLNLTGSVLSGDIATGTIANSRLANSAINFTLGTSGTDVSLSSSSASLGDTLTINIPSASATNRGLVTTGVQTLAGSKTFTGTTTTSGTLIASGDFITPRGVDYSTTGVQDDVDLGAGSYFHYAGGADATFNGIVGGTDGKQIRILNDTDYDLTITNQSLTSTASSRVETPSGQDVIIPPELTVGLQYDGGSNRWHIVSLPTTANSIRSYAYLQGGNAFGAEAVLGSTDAYGLNFITSGNTRFNLATTSATLTGNGVTAISSNNSLALSSGATYGLSLVSGTTGNVNLDSGTTGNIDIGTSTNAKTITIGNTTGATTLNLKAGSGGINLGGNVTISDGYSFTTGTGIVTTNSNAFTLTATSSVIDMTGLGILGLNTTTNRAINTGTGMFTTGGNLTIGGNKLYMGSNATGSLLVADGSGFNPVVLSGDATINSSGVLTLNYAGAQHADTTNTGFLTSADWNTFYNKQNALGFTAENVANKSTDVTLASSSDTLYPSQKAVKTYVDNRVSGLNWQNPVELINVIEATSTPVSTSTIPNYNGYIINTGGATGAWAAFAEGDLIQYQNPIWKKIKSLSIGDRFGIGFKSTSTPAGVFAGYENYVATVVSGTPGAYNYTFVAPANNDTLFVENTNAYYHNVTFTYSSTLLQWVQMSATVDWVMGSGIQATGNVASLGPLTVDWAQTGAFDINTSGNINIGNGKSLSVAGTSTLSGNVVMPKGADYSTTGVQNNVNLGAGSLFNYTGSGSATFTGFSGGTDGRFIRIINTSTSTLTLANQNTGSATTSRMIIETGGDVNILPDSSFELSYDAGVSRWRVVVLPANTALVNGGNSYGDNVSVGTADAYGLNFITNNTTRFILASSSATITGNGATTFTSNNTLAISSAAGSNLNVISGTTGDLNLDTGTTGTINIGTSSNSKVINIGNTTGATAINLSAGSGKINLNGNVVVLDGGTLTTGTGLLTISSQGITLASSSSIIDMTGSGTLGLNTTTNRPITTGSGLFTTGGNLTVTGTSTLNGNIVATGNFSAPKVDFSTTGSQNDVDLGIGSLIRYTGVADATFTGVSGGADGRYVMVMNASSYNLNLKHQSASSTAANRLIIETGADVVIAPNSSFQMQYDAGVPAWRVIVLPTTATDIAATAFVNGGNNFNANTFLGTTGAYGLNFITSGNTRFNLATTSATLTGNGATTISSNNSLTLTSAAGNTLSIVSGTTGGLNLDSGTTGNIDIGTSTNAKTITVGNGTGATSVIINAGTGNIDIGANAVARTINVGTGAGVVENINIGGTGDNVIAIGNTQTGGSISFGAGLTTGTISIGGTGAQTGTLDLAPGTGAQTVTLANGSGIKTLNIGSGVSGNTISIGNGANSSAQIVNISAGAAGANSTVNILTGVATAGTQTLNLGTGASAKTINIGNQTGATALTLDSGTGDISIGTGAQARTINVGTGAAVQTVTVGSTNGASTLTLEAGTGALNIGTGAFAKTITMGNSTGATGIAINSGTGGITLLTGTTGNVSIKSGTTGSVTLDSGTTGTVSIGTGNNAKTINIGTGTAGNAINIGTNNTTADTISIGSALDTLNIIASTQTNGNVPLCVPAAGGRVRYGATASSCNTSSLRFKHDVKNLDLGLKVLLALRPVDYKYNDNDSLHNGLIAEEVYPLIPSAVVLDAEGLPYALDYNDILPVIIKGIQEQQVLLGDISLDSTSGDNGLSTLVSVIQTEIAHNPIVIIGDKIANGQKFLTDFVSARITAIRGYFDEVFTKKVHTEELCVKKSDGSEVCVSGDEIQALLDQNGIILNNTTVSEPLIDSTETDPEPIIEETVSSTEDSPVTEEEPTSSSTPETAIELEEPVVEIPAEETVVEPEIVPEEVPVEEQVANPQ
jgi:hypothetical protein